MKKLIPAVVIACLLLTGCGNGTPRMSVDESCTFLNSDTFKPSGNQQQQADQIAKHYQEVADKVAPEIADPIEKMADVMKQVAGTALGDKSEAQIAELTKQNNRIGDVCK